MTPAALFMRRAERTAALGSIVLPGTVPRTRRRRTGPPRDLGLTANVAKPRSAALESATAWRSRLMLPPQGSRQIARLRSASKSSPVQDATYRAQCCLGAASARRRRASVRCEHGHETIRDGEIVGPRNRDEDAARARNAPKGRHGGLRKEPPLARNR